MISMMAADGPESSEESFHQTDSFLWEIFEKCLEKAVKAGRDRKNPYLQFKPVEELKKCIDLRLTSEGVGHPELLRLCDKVIEYSILTGHPRYFPMGISGLDPYGFAGEIVTNSLTVNVIVYQKSPAFTLIEMSVIKHIQDLIGFPGEGIFCPGGSYSNMVATTLARFRRFPESRVKGTSCLPRMKVFTSEQSHYSVKKNAIFLGYGEENCVSVKCDERGRMMPGELEQEIIKSIAIGDVPVVVTATAGTTALGAFDPLHSIADVCEKYNIWMHVDGAWGASVMLSKKYKHLCSGIERADSLSWNFHKMICAPNQCSLFLVKGKGLLQSLNVRNIPVLFLHGTLYDENYDLGTKSLQCGRRVDSFKLWLMWKAKGNKGLENHIEKCFDNSMYAMQAIRSRPSFRLVIPEPQCTNVPFWYTPPSMSDRNVDEAYFEDLSKVVFEIRKRLLKDGKLYLGFSSTPNHPTFFNMLITNELVNHQDMDFVLDEIERVGQDL